MAVRDEVSAPSGIYISLMQYEGNEGGYYSVYDMAGLRHEG